MSFKHGGMSNYVFGMMSQCPKTKISKGDCGCHPYPKCSTCNDIGRVPPGEACSEGCQASIDIAKIREENRKKHLKHNCPFCKCDQENGGKEK